jgi:hypothetical protein
MIFFLCPGPDKRVVGRQSALKSRWISRPKSVSGGFSIDDMRKSVSLRLAVHSNMTFLLSTLCSPVSVAEIIKRYGTRQEVPVSMLDVVSFPSIRFINDAYVKSLK